MRVLQQTFRSCCRACESWASSKQVASSLLYVAAAPTIMILSIWLRDRLPAKPSMWSLSRDTCESAQGGQGSCRRKRLQEGSPCFGDRLPAAVLFSGPVAPSATRLGLRRGPVLHQAVPACQLEHTCLKLCPRPDTSTKRRRLVSAFAVGLGYVVEQ